MTVLPVVRRWAVVVVAATGRRRVAEGMIVEGSAAAALEVENTSASTVSFQRLPHGVL